MIPARLILEKIDAAFIARRREDAYYCIWDIAVSSPNVLLHLSQKHFQKIAGLLWLLNEQSGPTSVNAVFILGGRCSLGCEL